MAQRKHPGHCAQRLTPWTDLEACGEENVADLRQTIVSLRTDTSTAKHQEYTARLAKLKDVCDAEFRAVTWRDVKRCWRCLYTDALLAWSLADLLLVADQSVMPGDPELNIAAILLGAIHRLDLTIIVAGTPGRGRREICLRMIELCQSEYKCLDQKPGLPSEPIADSERPRKRIRQSQADEDDERHRPDSSQCDVRAKYTVPVFEEPPSMEDFSAKLSEKPFVVRRFAQNWPAFDPHEGQTSPKWASREYLASIAGPGRVVPVELGKQYTDDEWTQRIMPWDEFLSRAGFPYSDDDSHDSRSGEVYLAQHTLLEQFPKLEQDILMPDYVYADHDCPSHSPPTRTVEPRLQDAKDAKPTLEQTVMTSLWIGPAGTLSPPHTDPYFNCFGECRRRWLLSMRSLIRHLLSAVQVVGSKHVWIAPPAPHVDKHMYCFGHDKGGGDEEAPSADAETQRGDDEEAPSPSADTQRKRSASPQDLTSLMTNTSQVPVFEGGPQPPLFEDAYPDFTDHVEPRAMHTVLQPGDLLFLPPGWWHSIQSLEKVSRRFEMHEDISEPTD